MNKELDVVLKSPLSRGNSIETSNSTSSQNVFILVRSIAAYSVPPVAVAVITGHYEWLSLLFISAVVGFFHAGFVEEGWNMSRRTSRMLKKKGIRLSWKEKFNLAYKFNSQDTYDFSIEHVSKYENIMITSELRGNDHHLKIDLSDKNSFDETFYDALTIQNSVSDFDDSNAKLMSNVTVFQKNVRSQLAKINSRLAAISKKEGRIPYGITKKGDAMCIEFRHAESLKLFNELKKTCANDLDERLKSNI